MTLALDFIYKGRKTSWQTTLTVLNSSGSRSSKRPVRTRFSQIISSEIEAFLAAFAPKPELAVKVAPRELEKTLGNAIEALPRGQ